MTTPKTTSSKTTTKSGIKAKLADRLPRRNAKAKSTRITNDNIGEHREDILAKGRKFKYPAQYSKNRLIIITVVVVLVTLGAFGLWLNNALYKKQQTGDFYYSVTKILPLSAASVDGEPVRYQDYLRRLRADIHYYINREGRSFNSEEGKKELDYHKRKNLAVAEKAAYVDGLARKHDIKVTNQQIDERIKQMREADGATEEDLISTLKSYYGWTLDDFRITIQDQMLEQVVSYAIDTKAKSKIEKIEKRLVSGVDFTTVAKEMSEDELTKERGSVITVKTDEGTDPTGIATEVAKLKVGKTTGIKQVQLGNDNYYYIAKLTDKKEKSISYQIIMVKLNKLNDDFAKLQKDGKIKEYITVPEESSFNK